MPKTKIYNRYGFDEFSEKMIQKNPNAHFVAALLDIDNFKFINDISKHLPGAFIIYRADGTYFSVLDHRRIVESPQYGKVFYVLFMDWKDMHIRYNDKFAR